LLKGADVDELYVAGCDPSMQKKMSGIVGAITLIPGFTGFYFSCGIYII
jgi:hypothetical protein